MKLVKEQNMPQPSELHEVSDLSAYRNKKRNEHNKKTTYLSLVFLLSMTLIFVVIAVWCKNTVLEESVPGMGQFVPEMKVRKITSATGGIVSKVYVQEDQFVKKGQVLAILDPELTEVEQSGILSQINILQEDISSINDAYTNSKTKNYSKMKQAWVNAAQQTLQSRMNEADEEIQRSQFDYKQAVERFNKTDKILKSGEEMLVKYKKLYDSGGIPLNDVKEYEQQVVAKRGELLAQEQEVKARKADLNKALEIPNEIKSSYQKDLLDRVSDYRRAVADLQNRIVKTGLSLKREKIVSPIDGVINEQIIRGSGETVNPGDALFSVVPTGSKVIAEIKVTNRDLAYIHKGQKVMLKMDALPYQKFGKLHGTVESISPSTIPDHEGRPFYIIRVKPDNYTLKSNHGETHGLKSGMTVAADFITQKKNIFEFITEPVQEQLDKAFKDPSTR